MASNRMATRASGRGRLLKGLALGDLTNVAPAERQQAGKAAGSGLKNLISEAVGAISGAGKRKRVSAAVADVENEKVEARPAKAGRVGSGPRARRLQSARQQQAQDVVVIDSDTDENVVDYEARDRRHGLAGPAPVLAADPTHPGYPFCATGGRRQVEGKHPTSLYIFPQGLVLFSSYTRQQLVDWVMATHQGLKLDEETLHLAIRYVDTFLTRRGPEAFLTDPRKHQVLQEHPAVEHGKQLIFPQGFNVEPLCNKLKRLGSTCLFVASKVAEINSYSAVDFAHAAGVPLFNREQIILAERALLRTLSFDVYLPTASSYLSANIHAAETEISLGKRKGFQFSQQFRDVANLYVDLTLLSHGALAWQPSQLAAAAVSVALEKAGEPDADWASGKLSQFTGYSLAELAPARELVMGLARDALEMRRTVDREPRRNRVNTPYMLNLALNLSYTTETMQIAVAGVPR